MQVQQAVDPVNSQPCEWQEEENVLELVSRHKHLDPLKPSEAMLVMLPTRPGKGRILSGLADLKPNHLTQSSPRGH